MVKILVVALSVALLAAPALAVEQTTPAAPASGTDAAKPAKPVKTKPAAKEKTICVQDQSTTGSRIPRFICKTESQLEEERYKGQQIREQFRNEGPQQYPL